jgi:hypothetical protein
VPCFRYRGEDFVAQLSVEQGEGTNFLVRCPIRKALYSLTPEERVRQAVIWFLLVGASDAGGWRKRLRFEAEQRSLDVAAFLATESSDNRFIFNIPVLIVETKRLERELTDDGEIELQLKTYMIRERCRAGLIFNARQATWLSIFGDFTQGCWTADRMFDLSEAEDRLQEAVEAARVTVLDHENASARAARGDFDSLLRLISLIGHDSRLTVALSIRFRGNLSSVQAFNLQVCDANTISYRTRGVISRNRQQRTRQDFHSLLAVRSL